MYNTFNAAVKGEPNDLRFKQVRAFAMSDQEIQNETQPIRIGATRLPPTAIESEIASEHYFTGFSAACVGEAVYHRENHDADALRRLTFCVLVLNNGLTATGDNAFENIDNLDTNIGHEIARQNAVNKIWGLLGYE